MVEGQFPIETETQILLFSIYIRRSAIFKKWIFETCA